MNDRERASAARNLFLKAENVFSSELSSVECQAALIETEGDLNVILARLQLIGINSIILGVARYLVRIHRRSHGLRSSDAIHIATAKLISESFKQVEQQLVFLTADQRQHIVLSAEGVESQLLK
jgi:predicted nucleic acid-binding protein